LVRGRQRARQMAIARLRMMAEVPRANVVVVNPTHCAVALRYERSRGGAPRVVAKGVDRIAARIRTIAEEHRIPIYEDPPLAWAPNGIREGARPWLTDRWGRARERPRHGEAHGAELGAPRHPARHHHDPRRDDRADAAVRARPPHLVRHRTVHGRAALGRLRR